MVYSFKGGRDGQNPTAQGLIAVNGILYGTVQEGGIAHLVT